MAKPFVVVDGIDGAGKTTQISVVKDYLRKYGDPLQIREPGGTPLGESIRQLLLDPSNKINQMSELLLFFTARHQLIDDVVLPNLNKRPIIADRFWPATVAYQGYGRLPDLATSKLLDELVGTVKAKVKPDLFIILDLPPELAYERFTNRGDKDRFEQEQLSFFYRVRQGYQSLVGKEFVSIDCSGTIEETSTKILEVLDQHLKGFDYE